MLQRSISIATGRIADLKRSGNNSPSPRSRQLGRELLRERAGCIRHFEDFLDKACPCIERPARRAMAGALCARLDPFAVGPGEAFKAPHD